MGGSIPGGLDSGDFNADGAADLALEGRPDTVLVFLNTSATADVPLSVRKDPAGRGTVTSRPPGIACGTRCAALFPPGTVVTLQAAPAPASLFTGWTGDPDCADGQVTLAAATTCVAGFVREPRFAVAGTVRHRLTRRPLRGVTVTLSGRTTATRATDARGRYRFNELLAGRYVLTPSKMGLLLTPPARSVRIRGADLPRQDFQGREIRAIRDQGGGPAPRPHPVSR